MPTRRLPVRPALDQLERQAKDLLRAIRAGEAASVGPWIEVEWSNAWVE